MKSQKKGSQPASVTSKPSSTKIKGPVPNYGPKPHVKLLERVVFHGQGINKPVRFPIWEVQAAGKTLELTEAQHVAKDVFRECSVLGAQLVRITDLGHRYVEMTK